MVDVRTSEDSMVECLCLGEGQHIDENVQKIVHEIFKEHSIFQMA